MRQAERPTYVVWELTLACDQPCTHCGSRAGTAREGELSTDKALEVVKQLAAAGTFEVVLIGGEAYLHPGFLAVVRALREAGIRPSMTTGGRGIDRALARQMAQAGLHTVSVSIDGLEPTHDLMRASKGSFASAFAALGHLYRAGLRTASNINLNRLNHADLEPLYEQLKDTGIGAWQVQLTAPLGRAADRAAMLLQPWDLVELVPRIAKLKARAWQEAQISLQPGNNLGYFGPEEAALRSPRPGMNDHFQGCQAGKQLMGIESSGALKGCPSLQSDAYVRGSLAKEELAEVWSRLAVRRTVEDLWGFCKSCPYAETCLGGCTFTAHAFFGRPGNNPYCHYRARTLAARGVRERLVLKQQAPGRPFDHALFELVEEPLDAPDVKPPTPRQLVKRSVALGFSPSAR
ncbi:MAG: radical SAM protein [Archangiaceae bacterium]|nr:radical SAM protein [Archangiaceae bacterium]